MTRVILAQLLLERAPYWVHAAACRLEAIWTPNPALLVCLVPDLCAGFVGLDI